VLRVFVDGGPAACSFLFLYVLGFGFRINDIESQLHVPAHDADEGSFASAHDPLLMHPETLAPSLLPYVSGTVLEQFRVCKLDAPGGFTPAAVASPRTATAASTLREVPKPPGPASCIDP